MLVKELVRDVPWYLFLGFAVASIGGPLALASIYLPKILGAQTSAYPEATLLGVSLFLFPLLIWYRYSAKIASSGGLYSFVKAATNEKIARVQAIIWIFSYLLYIPYTVTYITYYLLPGIFSDIGTYAPFIELLLPILIIALMLSNKRHSLIFLFVLSIVQLGIMAFFAYYLFSAPIQQHQAPETTTSLAALQNGGSTGLLFICASLPLFLGGEAKGGAKAVRRLLLVSFLLVAGFLLLTSLAFSQINGSALGAKTTTGDLGVLSGIANLYSNPNLLYTIGILSVISTIGIIIAEFFSISRLVNSMTKISIRKALVYTSVFLFVFDAISLIDPKKIYEVMLFPSLIALYVSQLIVFLAYPVFLIKSKKISLLDVVAVIASVALMLYGLYTTLTNPL